MHCRAGGRSDHGDPLGIGRQRLFVSRVKKALRLELGLELLKGHCQISRAQGREGIAVELIGSVPWKHGDAPGRHHRHAVFRTEAQLGRRPLEHDAPEGTLRVLEGKVVVPGGIHFVVGQLAPHTDGREHGLPVQQVLDQLVHLGHAENMLFHGRLLAVTQKQSRTAADAASRSARALIQTVSWRTKLPRMPLINFTVSGVSYFFAISTASLMETPLGISGM